jgi:hypothetical protein
LHIPISFADLEKLGSSKLFVHGIIPFPGGMNHLLQNSGLFPYPNDFSVKGLVEGFTVTPQASIGTLTGWACNYGISKSISVHVYVGGPYGQGQYLKNGIANAAVDSSVSDKCGTSGIAHRFSIPITQSEMQTYRGQKFFVHGISAVSGYSNNLLGNGGVFP